MWLELFVISMCAGDYQCSEALRAYKSTSQGSSYIKSAKKLAYKYVDREAAAIVGTFYAGISNKKIKLRLRKGLTFEGNRDNIDLIYKWEF